MSNSPYVPLGYPVDPESVRHSIIHDEAGLLVVDKPAGVPTSGRVPEDPQGLQGILMARFRRKIWAVHQLDSDTSGVNVFVRRKTLVSEYQRRMAAPNGRKTYLAWAHGRPNWDEKIVEAPIGIDPRSGRRGVVQGGKPSRSVVRVLVRGPSSTLFRVRIDTGRTHQIRIHLSHLGHPVFGEPYYADPPCERLWRHTLHAFELRFRDGVRPDVFRAPLPDELLAFSAELGIEVPRDFAAKNQVADPHNTQ